MARKIDDFVKQTIQEQYQRALEFLRTHRDKLEKLAKALLKKETMTVDEFLDIFEGRKEVSEETEETQEELPLEEETGSEGEVQVA
jgi:cell division protease FtsH